MRESSIVLLRQLILLKVILTPDPVIKTLCHVIDLKQQKRIVAVVLCPSDEHLLENSSQRKRHLLLFSHKIYYNKLFKLLMKIFVNCRFHSNVVFLLEMHNFSISNGAIIY